MANTARELASVCPTQMDVRTAKLFGRGAMGSDLVRSDPSDTWVIDFGVHMSRRRRCAITKHLFSHVLTKVQPNARKPKRDNTVNIGGFTRNDRA